MIHSQEELDSPHIFIYSERKFDDLKSWIWYYQTQEKYGYNFYQYTFTDGPLNV